MKLINKKMKLKIYFIVSLFLFNFSISQEIFFKAGKNFTNYSYKNSLGKSISGLEGSVGSNYELGFDFFFDDADSSLESRFSYSLSLCLNQFNAKGGDFNNTYVWNTNYLGLQNMVYASIIKSPDYYFDFKLKLGFNTSKFISGQQFINNTKYNLNKYDEFNGLFIQPLVGMDLRLDLSRELSFYFSYIHSQAFNISNNSSERLNFINHQIQVGIQYTLF